MYAKGMRRIMENGNLAKTLVDLRKNKKLTQKALASKLDYSDKVISKWETGESLPDVMALKKLADFYDVSIDSIVLGTSKKDSIPPSERTDHRIKLKQIKGPSRLLWGSLLIWTLLFLSTFFGDIAIFLVAAFVYSVILLTYGIVLSYYTWEGEYQGHVITVRNRPLQATLEMDGKPVDQNHALFGTHVKLRSTADNRTIKAYIHGFVRFSCDLFVE
jgi:transcriptional regulator with XRE-family HTH domain